MKKQYSIGEMAGLMGISAQMLRRYSNFGLIKPCYVNPETGYRYYDASNFSPIDRAKYLQKLGFSLAEIRELYQRNDMEQMAAHLEGMIQQKEEKLRRESSLLEELRWYEHFFRYTSDGMLPEKAYIRYCPRCYAFMVERMPGEPPELGNERLYLVKNQPPYNHLGYRRQNVLLYETDDFFKGQLEPFQYGFYLDSQPEGTDPHFFTFQEGYYICFQSRILTGAWSPELFRHFFEKTARPAYVIADEYENNLFQFKECVYEIRLYFDQPAL